MMCDVQVSQPAEYSPLYGVCGVERGLVSRVDMTCKYVSKQVVYWDIPRCPSILITLGLVTYLTLVINLITL